MNSPNHPLKNTFTHFRLSSLFIPIKNYETQPLFQLKDYFNSKMIQQGIKLNKIGLFKPSEIATFPSFNHSQLTINGSYPTNSSDINCTSFPSLNLNNNHISSSKTTNYQPDSYTQNLINSSAFNRPNEINSYHLKPFDVSIPRNDNDSFGSIANADNNKYNSLRTNILPQFTGIKKKRFITRDYHSYENGYHNENSKNKFTIQANKMTRKLIEENISYNNNKDEENNDHGIEEEMNNLPKNNNGGGSYKNKKENSCIVFNETNSIAIGYQHLLDNFDSEIDDGFNINNLPLINQYKSSIENHENKEVLSFGENPLIKFKDWMTWLKQEQDKESTEQSKELCEDIIKTLNSISLYMSSLPIFVFPNQSGSNMTELIHKQSKKRKEQSFNDFNNNKPFCCSFCNEMFQSGQGLGGHMSRKHKDQSAKFKHKKEIRNKREPLRHVLTLAKQELCQRHLLDYVESMKSRDGKKNIKALIADYNEEYKRIKNDLKKTMINQ